MESGLKIKQSTTNKESGLDSNTHKESTILLDSNTHKESGLDSNTHKESGLDSNTHKESTIQLDSNTHKESTIQLDSNTHKESGLDSNTYKESITQLDCVSHLDSNNEAVSQFVNDNEVFYNSDDDTETRDVQFVTKMTKEEMEKEKELATKKELVELGKILANKEYSKNLFEKTYLDLNNKFNNSFDFNFYQESNNEKTFLINETIKKLTQLSQTTTFSNNESDLQKFHQMCILNEMSKYKYEMENKRCQELQDNIKELQEEGDEMVAEIEENENTNKTTINHLNARIIKLRQKCLDKNKTIKYYQILAFTLAYLAVISLERGFYQLQIIFSFLSHFMSYSFKFLDHTLQLLIHYNILPVLVGIVGGICGYVFWKKSLKSDENKKNEKKLN